MMSLPRRTHVSTTEKVIGGLILLLLVLVASGVFLKGRHYDPSIYVVDESTLASTHAPVENKASTLRESTDAENGSTQGTVSGGHEFEDYESHGSTTPVIATSSNASSVLDGKSAFAGLEPMGEMEHYTADTLYVKINGRAPAYLGFNFQELICRTFRIVSEPGQYLDVFIYYMDTPINAFGIFSLEREVGAKAVDFVGQGYQSEMGFFLQQGNAYVQVIASDVKASVIAAADRLSRELAALIPVDDTGIGAAAMLPSQHQIPGSLSYLQEYAYGIEQLRDVFEARYAVDDTEFTFFGMKAQRSAVEAAFAGVRAYFSDYGTLLEEFEINSASVIIGECFEQYSVVFLQNDAIGGVMNADSLETPKQFVQTLLNPNPNPQP